MDTFTGVNRGKTADVRAQFGGVRDEVLVHAFRIIAATVPDILYFAVRGSCAGVVDRTALAFAAVSDCNVFASSPASVPVSHVIDAANRGIFHRADAWCRPFARVPVPPAFSPEERPFLAFARIREYANPDLAPARIVPNLELVAVVCAEYRSRIRDARHIGAATPPALVARVTGFGIFPLAGAIGVRAVLVPRGAAGIVLPRSDCPARGTGDICRNDIAV